MMALVRIHLRKDGHRTTVSMERVLADVLSLLNDNYISPKATTISPHPEGRR
jgi:hypothetical protein